MKRIFAGTYVAPWTNTAAPAEPEAQSAPPTPPPSRPTPLEWAVSSFGPEAKNQRERATRLLEEATEYAQAEGVDVDVAHALITRVYDRPAGLQVEELRGVALTLAVGLENLGLSYQDLVDAEMDRVLAKPPEYWRDRHNAKLADGITGFTAVEPTSEPVTAETTPIEPTSELQEEATITPEAGPAHTPPKPWAPNAIFYHAGCHDGFGAAYLAGQRWPAAALVPASYDNVDEKLDEWALQDVLMVDLSCPTGPDTPAANCRSLLILDHHKTAFDKITHAHPLRPLDQMFDVGDASPPEGHVYALLDNDRSGVRLVWDWLNPSANPPYWVELVEDRDLWRWTFPESAAFHESMALAPQTIPNWHSAVTRPVDFHVDRGSALLLRKSQMIDSCTPNAQEIRLHSTDPATGKRVLHLGVAMNAPYQLASDGGNSLLKLHPTAEFACVWYLRGDGKIALSLRSEARRADVSEIAKRLGGGGHRNASGCTLPSLVQLANLLAPLGASVREAAE